MIFRAFLIGFLVSAYGFYNLGLIIGMDDGDSLIWFTTSLIIATICGCSAWIVKTIKEK